MKELIIRVESDCPCHVVSDLVINLVILDLERILG